MNADGDFTIIIRFDTQNERLAFLMLVAERFNVLPCNARNYVGQATVEAITQWVERRRLVNAN